MIEEIGEQLRMCGYNVEVVDHEIRMLDFNACNWSGIEFATTKIIDYLRQAFEDFDFDYEISNGNEFLIIHIF